LERKLRPEAEAPKVLGRPDVLLIYGENDKFTPPEHGKRLLQAFGHAAHSQLAVLPDTDHTYAYRDAADAYESLTLPFLGKLSGRAA
jgi:pimeloyl-ACP methyl ester carboxylesterase